VSAVTAKWALTRLGDICEFKYGKSLPEAARAGGEVSVFGSNGVVGAHNSAITEGPTIVIGRKGSHGEVNFSQASCWPIDTTYYVDRSATKADIRWLFHRLCSAGLNQMNRAAAVPGLNREDAYRVEILLPPLEEQRRIAAILDQAETLRTQRRTALTLLDSLTQSLFLDMFGDPSAEYSEWFKTPLDAVAELVTGYPFRSEEYVGLDKGIKLCRGVNVLPGRLDWRDMACWPHEKVKEAEAFNLRAGDIVMAMDRPWIAEGFKIARVDGADCPMLLVQRVARIRPKSAVTKEYLLAVLSHGAFARHCKPTETTIPHISPKDIRSFAFPLPPLPLQQTFAARIASIEALKGTHRRALVALDALFASLQQRAFSGELTLAAPRASAQSLAQLQQLEASIGQEALIFIAKRMPNGDLYNSLKAIYFADRHHLEHHGRQIYNETYSALTHGPVPQAAYDATEVLIGKLMFSSFDDGAVRAALLRNDKKLTALRDADFSKLSRAVVESLEWGIRYCRDMKFGQTKTASHDSAYERTPKNEAIPLQYIIDTLPPEARQRHWNI
jgi:type I restriction enzyme, S subunit